MVDEGASTWSMSMDLGYNICYNIPFVIHSYNDYASVGVGILKYSMLMGTFPFPPPPPSTNIAQINMISSFSNRSLRYFDPWVPCLEEFESYKTSTTPIEVEIASSVILSVSTNFGQHLHPHIKCDHLTPPTHVFDSLSSHDFLDPKFPLDKAILDVMASIFNTKDEMIHRLYFPNLELMRVIMMNLDLRLGEFFES
jgi:hypothetical protein